MAQAELQLLDEDIRNYLLSITQIPEDILSPSGISSTELKDFIKRNTKYSRIIENQSREFVSDLIPGLK
jgi:hypothetical protein